MVDDGLVAVREAPDGGAGGRRVGRVHRLTAAVQVAFAVPFLVMGGLKLDQVRFTASADLGFEPDGLYALPLDPEDGASAEEQVARRRQLRNGLRAAPGVTGVTAASGLPLDFRGRATRVTRGADGQVVWVHVTRVAPDYAETMGLRIRQGRGITADDRAGGVPTVVISQPLADRLFPGEPVIGRRIAFGLDGSQPADHTVVGVTDDMVTSQMGTQRQQLFVSLDQHPSASVVLIARSSGTAESMTSALGNVLRDQDPQTVRAALITGAGLVRRSMRDLLGHSILAGLGAGIVLTLAALGVFGIVAFMVATRTREIGMHIALGAPRSRVVGRVLTDALKLVLPGLVVGLIAAAYFVRNDSEFSWYAVGVAEPIVYATAAAIVVLVAIVAAFQPARRAASIEPAVAMRAE